MPEVLFPVASALLWACSAPIVNRGLVRLDGTQPLQVLWGLWVALLAGVLALSPLALSRVPVSSDVAWGWLVLAGIFTFPLATGLYYAAAVAFKDRIEIASQFTKVKPALTLLLGVCFLPSVLVKPVAYPSAFLLVVGVAIYLFAASKRVVGLSGVGLGLATAGMWAIGEIFMQLGVGGTAAPAANFISLVAGLVLLTIVVIPILIRRGVPFPSLHVLWPFAVHGVISFGAAYSFFYQAVKSVGIGPTVLINAFWPLLGMVFAVVDRRRRGQPSGIPAIIWLASLCMLGASLTQLGILLSKPM